ncbi:MAG: hypothetical protein M4579_000968 [Chaenotheca gracillima]|nr:MAG: hypothetical protein M4579_000968 [Chaenotheca gracillima]
MLTSSRQSHMPSFSFHDAQSDEIPYYFTGLSNPVDFNPKFNADTLNLLANYQSMYDPSVALQPPPIRVQQSSPSPHPLQSSPPQRSMLAEPHWSSPPRKTHQRNASGSSIGSAGPTSPYDGSHAQPYIARSDGSLSPGHVDSSYYDASGQGDLTKQSSASSGFSFLAPAFQQYSSQQDSPQARLAMLHAMQQEQFSADQGSPATVSTGRPSADSPATPRTVPDEYEDTSSHDHSVPHIHRTMSEIYQDELFDPYNMSAPPQRPTSSSQLLSPYRKVFNERIQAAQQARSQSPMSTSSRERSPFREGSTYAPSIHSVSRSPQKAVNTASHLREQQKAEADSTELQHHQQSLNDSMSAPNTISPKEALLDFNETDETPLFPEDSYEPSQQDFDEYTQQGLRRGSSNFAPQNFPFVPPSVPGSVQMPQQSQYTYVQHQPASFHAQESTPEFPAHLVSMETSASDVPDSSQGSFDRRPSGVDIRKPKRTAADSGTYTCTYHGCPLRFETPAKLQKHKREGHRQGTPAQRTSPLPPRASVSPSRSVSPSLRNTQAGPHKCERINPSTGKPCNTIFSRPYDLTRHEDTIHNARKLKVRCQYCTEEKTFSRNDALTRHMRVVHPEMPFGGRGSGRRRHI